MKYKCIDGTIHCSRRGVRDHCQSIGLGREIKENYIQIPDNSCDTDSIQKGYSCVEGSYNHMLHSKDPKAWGGDYYKNYYKKKQKRFENGSK